MMVENLEERDPGDRQVVPEVQEVRTHRSRLPSLAIFGVRLVLGLLT